MRDVATNQPPRRVNTLFWFTHDLRLHDNRALLAAARNTRYLLCVYCVDRQWFAGNNYLPRRIGEQRWRFLRQSLTDLDQQLRLRGQRLQVLYGEPGQRIADVIARCRIDAIFRSAQVGFDERQQWRELRRRFPYLHFRELSTFTLYDEEQLPLPLIDLPATFSGFYRALAPVPITAPVPAPDILPQVLATDVSMPIPPAALNAAAVKLGGERAALEFFDDFFSGSRCDEFYATHKKLASCSESGGFSAWLACGCLSVRQLYQAAVRDANFHKRQDRLRIFQTRLLRREYFQWLARRHGARLFAPDGTGGWRPLTSFYGQHFSQWLQGCTPWPLVNACINQLNGTGYLSNLGRKIVASCLVNELQLDWRAGAYYFEMQLIDYDVAVNWGNWQEIAGVSVGNRRGRHYDIDRLTGLHDPQGRYIDKWQGRQNVASLDAVDAADWPIMPDH